MRGHAPARRIQNSGVMPPRDALKGPARRLFNLYPTLRPQKVIASLEYVRWRVKRFTSL